MLLYFSPETADNQPLRQCLTYFLPVYCYTAADNQRRMLSVSVISDSFTVPTDPSKDFLRHIYDALTNVGRGRG